jgi:hypothetical protein
VRDGLRRPRRDARHWLGAGVALAVGLGAASIDTRPEFDDTGVLAFGLIAGGAVAAVMTGRAGIGWLVALALGTGLPVPAAELAPGGSPASLLALAFAAAGVLIGTGVTHVLEPRPRSTSS